MNWNDPAFWSVIIAGIAVFLSQIPPIRDILKGKKVRITNPDTFQLYHQLGNINLTLFLDIHNVGGRPIVIDKLYCLIIDDNENTFPLPAKGYIPRSVVQSDKLPEFPVGRIILKPDERWYENTHFYKMWNDAVVEEAEEIILSVRNNITEKLNEKKEDEESLVKTDLEVHQRVVQFFNRNFVLRKGNYKFLIIALDENNNLLAIKGYEFTLFESHIRMLNSYLDDYQYGAGIYYPIQDSLKYLWIRLRIIDDERRVKQIYDRFSRKF